MDTKTILKQLRESHHLTQDQMAEWLMVTRQAVSRWETGETQPNTDTLRTLSMEFNVSINTLLGSPGQLICRCPVDPARCPGPFVPIRPDFTISLHKNSRNCLYLTN